MAKDKRRRTASGGQVNLTQAVSSGSGSRSTSSATPRRRPKKKKRNVGKIILTVLMLILVGVSIAFVVTVLDILFGNNGGTEWPDASSFDTTPEAYSDKVSYYMVGVLGEDADDEMLMASVICHDKKENKISILEIPRQTYIGGGQWSVSTVAQIWANPAPLNWCEKCKRQVFDAEISDDGTHNLSGCETAITQKTGSSIENLLEVSNDFLGLPIDEYFFIPKEALLKLVNLTDGIDVELERSITVGDITYGTGVQTIDGEAAVSYITPSKNTVAVELEMMKKRRQVMFALFERLRLESADAVTLFEASDAKTLTDEIICPLQYGSTPIRTALDPDEIIEFLAGFKTVPAANITVYTLPGEATVQNKTTYFTVHTDELLTLLNNEFNPYGEPITASDIVAKQIDDDESSDMQQQTMDQVVAPQSMTPLTDE